MAGCKGVWFGYELIPHGHQKNVATKLLLRLWSYIMSKTTSFAPLAARLAAQAAELRPVDGARDDLAKFAALVMCALLDMLILVCEMLDTRALAGRASDRMSLNLRKTASSRADLVLPPSHIPVAEWSPSPRPLWEGSGEGFARIISSSATILSKAHRSRPNPSPGLSHKEREEERPAFGCGARCVNAVGLDLAIPASPWKPLSQKAVFHLAPTHAYFVTIS